MSSESKQDEEDKFVQLKDHPAYEIDSIYPHNFRKKIGGGLLTERVNDDGYTTVYLGETCYKHRLIAQHFIPNPKGLPYVDHINHDRSDNHVSNLRWISPLDNARNRASSNGIEYEFVDELEADALQINFVNGNEFEGYWLAGNEILYYDTSRYRVVIKHAYGNQWRVRMRDVDGNSRTISKHQLDEAMSDEYKKDFNI